MANLYPTGVRENSRYRGPIESSKMLRYGEDIALNLKMLYNKFSELDSLFAEVQEVLSDNNQFKTGRDLKVVSNKLETFEEEAMSNG